MGNTEAGQGKVEAPLLHLSEVSHLDLSKEEPTTRAELKIVRR
ncbi:hypothetical protein [Actinocorallia libanotica]|uniref:Uncharacterized protein n=1 Tax=Actinocorallia libanotica TaxID=46162 RepID=A0ABN1R4P2_9ACTN